MSKLVSIVIPTYNRKEMVTNLIKSLLSGSYKNIEVIAVDDASIDGTSEHLQKKFGEEPKVIIIRNNKNMFAAGSKNVGQGKARGELIAFIDDDNIADSKMIEELAKVLESEPDIGEVGPVNYVLGKKSKVLLAGSTRSMWTTRTSHARSLKGYKKDFWETDDIPNAFMVKKEVVLKNKIKFNRRFGIMYEESDYAYKIRKAGYKILFVKKAKIYHKIDYKDKDFISHFLADERRPFVFARNRVVFHYLYSSFLQNLFITSFWVWFFSVYYAMKFVQYKDTEVSIMKRLSAVISYVSGTVNGIVLVAARKKF